MKKIFDTIPNIDMNLVQYTFRTNLMKTMKNHIKKRNFHMILDRFVNLISLTHLNRHELTRFEWLLSIGTVHFGIKMDYSIE